MSRPWPSHWDNEIEAILRAIWMLDDNRYTLLMIELQDWPEDREEDVKQ